MIGNHDERGAVGQRAFADPTPGNAVSGVATMAILGILNGVIGIVSPWNYPYYLAMAPALAALAAGNRVMIKPSELTPATSALMARLVAEHFAPEEMHVVTGDAEVGKAFTQLPFDHLFFTGSTPVGRIVAQAAAKNHGHVAVLVDPADYDRVASEIESGGALSDGAP